MGQSYWYNKDYLNNFELIKNHDPFVLKLKGNVMERDPEMNPDLFEGDIMGVLPGELVRKADQI